MRLLGKLLLMALALCLCGTISNASALTVGSTSYPNTLTFNVTISSGTTPTFYQTKLVLNSTNVPSNWNWTNECVISGSNYSSRIAVVNESQTGSLDFWVENCSTTSSDMTLWVEVDKAITSSPGVNITIAYGNSTATAASSIENTAMSGQGDDFNDGNINWTKWQSTDHASYGETGGTLTLATPSASTKVFNNNMTLSNFTYEALVKKGAADGYLYGLILHTSLATYASNKGEFDLGWAAAQLQLNINGTGTSKAWAADITNYYRLIIKYPTAGVANAYFNYANGTTVWSDTTDTPGTAANLYLALLQWSGSGTSYVDWIFVRKNYNNLNAVAVNISSSASSTDNFPTATQTSPPDGFSRRNATSISVMINCSATDDLNIANLSILTNSTGTWHINQTTSLTGMANQTTWTLTMPAATTSDVIWACRAGDNSSQYTNTGNRTIKIIAPPANGTWVIGPPLPYGQADVAVQVVGDTAYIIDGYGYPNSTVVLRNNTAYNMSSGIYTQKANAQIATFGYTSAVVGNDIYLFGGYYYNVSDVFPYAERYNTSSNTWTNVSSMPFKAAGMSTVVYNGNIYIMGGWNTTVLKTLLLYYPNNDTYISLAPMTTGRRWGAAGIYNGVIYYLGGSQNGTSVGSTTCERYYTNNNTWASCAALPFTEFGSSLTDATIGSNIYISNGLDDPTFHNWIWEYNTSANSWAQRVSGTYSMDGHGTAIYDNAYYRFGGRNATTDPFGIVYLEIFYPYYQAPVDTTPPSPAFVTPTLANLSYTANNSWIFVNVSAGEDLSACLLDIYPKIISTNATTTAGYEIYYDTSDGSYGTDVEHGDLGRMASTSAPAWTRTVVPYVTTGITTNVSRARLYFYIDPMGVSEMGANFTIYAYYNSSFNWNDTYCIANATTRNQCWNATQNGILLGSVSTPTDNRSYFIDITSALNNDRSDGLMNIWFKSNKENTSNTTDMTDVVIDFSYSYQINPTLSYDPLAYQNVSMTMASGLRSCWYNATDLANNTAYYFRAWANDTAGNLNKTEDRQITINLTQSAPGTISDCGILNNAGTTYTLTADINNATTSSCLTVLADNITINCNGHTINGTNTTNFIGINITRSVLTVTNITIMNCVITNWYAGIKSSYGSGNNISYNTIYSNAYGIYVASSTNNIILNNNASYNTEGTPYYGGNIYVSASYNNYFINNTLVYGGHSGVIFDYSDAANNTVINGTIGGGSWDDYYVGAYGLNNTYVSTNFTTRKIGFDTGGTDGIFAYKHNFSLNLWLITNLSSPAGLPFITRTLTTWSQTDMKWNDSIDTLKRGITYNITGLLASTSYSIYNDSVLYRTMTTDGAGMLNFTINVSKTANGGSLIEVNLTAADTTPVVINITSPLNQTYNNWNGTAKNFNATWSINFAITNSSGNVIGMVYSIDGGSNITFTNNTAKNVDVMGHNITICANSSAGIWGCDTEYFEVNGGAGYPRISFNYTLPNVCSGMNAVTTGDFDGDGVNEIALGAMCDNASLWIMDNQSSGLQNWSAPRFVNYTNDVGGQSNEWIWRMAFGSMGGSSTLNELCISTGGLNGLIQCYKYNSTSKWYDQNYSYTAGDADVEALEFCDVNGDSQKELIGTLYTQGGWVVVHNYTETSPSTYISGNNFGDTGHCEDINGDGRMEFVSSDSSGAFKYLYWNTTASAYQIKSLSGSIWSSHTVFNDLATCDYNNDGNNETLIINTYVAPYGYNITRFNTTSLLGLSSVPLAATGWQSYGGGKINNTISGCQIKADAPGMGASYQGAIYDNISSGANTFFIGKAATATDDWVMDSLIDIDHDGYMEVPYYERSLTSTQGVKIVQALDFSPTAASYSDTTPPTVTLVTPVDAATSRYATATSFNCSATDDTAIANYSLFGNWSGWSINETIATSQPFSVFSKTINPGTYIWNCQVCDTLDNCAFAGANRTLTVNASTAAAITSPVAGADYQTVDAYNNNYVTLTYSFAVPGTTWSGYSLDGGANTSIMSIQTNTTLQKFGGVDIYYYDFYNNGTDYWFVYDYGSDERIVHMNSTGYPIANCTIADVVTAPRGIATNQTGTPQYFLVAEDGIERVLLYYWNESNTSQVNCQLNGYWDNNGAMSGFGDIWGIATDNISQTITSMFVGSYSQKKIMHLYNASGVQRGMLNNYNISMNPLGCDNPYALDYYNNSGQDELWVYCDGANKSIYVMNLTGTLLRRYNAGYITDGVYARGMQPVNATWMRMTINNNLVALVYQTISGSNIVYAPAGAHTISVWSLDSGGYYVQSSTVSFSTSVAVLGGSTGGTPPANNTIPPIQNQGNNPTGGNEVSQAILDVNQAIYPIVKALMPSEEFDTLLLTPLVAGFNTLNIILVSCGLLYVMWRFSIRKEKPIHGADGFVILMVVFTVGLLFIGTINPATIAGYGSTASAQSSVSNITSSIQNITSNYTYYVSPTPKGSIV